MIGRVERFSLLIQSIGVIEIWCTIFGCGLARVGGVGSGCWHVKIHGSRVTSRFSSANGGASIFENRQYLIRMVYDTTCMWIYAVKTSHGFRMFFRNEYNNKNSLEQTGITFAALAHQGSYLEYNYSMMKCNVDLNHAGNAPDKS